MALTCLHTKITVDAMKNLGFTSSAGQRAGLANAAVDDKQGNSSAETNLHAMRGPGQPDFECRQAVAKLIADGKKEISDAVVSAAQVNASDQKKADTIYELALRRLGETLHTLQDLSFHKYEPWPFRGIADAFLSDPNYMICHAIRDLGFVSVSNTIDVDVSWRIGQQVYVGVKGFHHPTNHFFDVPSGGQPPEIPGWGGMFTITFGGAPGSVQVRDPFRDSRGTAENPYTSMLSSGRADLSRAEDDTEKFIKTIQNDVEFKPDGAGAWASFLRYQSK